MAATFGARAPETADETRRRLRAEFPFLAADFELRDIREAPGPLDPRPLLADIERCEVVYWLWGSGYFALQKGKRHERPAPDPDYDPTVGRLAVVMTAEQVEPLRGWARRPRDGRSDAEIDDLGHQLLRRTGWSLRARGVRVVRT
jgi:hypothetical protein